MTDVNGRIALVTGAASGIGRQVSLELADRGARLVVWDLTGDRLAPLVDELTSRSGAKAHGYACDVADRTAVYETAGRVRADVGDPEVVVNNAGVVSGDYLLDIPDNEIEATFAVNTLALYWVTKAFLPAMIERNRGHVVTVASAAGLLGVAKQTDYSASKHAAVGFDESLRNELRRLAPGVMTTVVCPYYIDTGMFEGVRSRVPFLLPILKQERVGAAIARAIETDRRQLLVPPLVRLLPVVRILPVPAFDWLMDRFGINVSMDEFTGRSADPDA